LISAFITTLSILVHIFYFSQKGNNLSLFSGVVAQDALLDLLPNVGSFSPEKIKWISN